MVFNPELRVPQGSCAGERKGAGGILLHSEAAAGTFGETAMAVMDDFVDWDRALVVIDDEGRHGFS